MIHHNKTKHRIGHVLFIIGAFLALFGLSVLSPMNLSSTKAFGASEIIKYSNLARERSGRSILNVDESLMAAAQAKADDMAEQHFFAHVAPDGSEAWDYLRDVDYSYSYAGENLAITNEDAIAVINGWLASASHRENLLNSRFEDFGIGVAEYGDYEGHLNTTVVVAMYGQPRTTQSLAVTSAATTTTGTTEVLKPRTLAVSPVLIGSIAGFLMLFGVVLELKHLHRLHRLPNFTN